MISMRLTKTPDSPRELTEKADEDDGDDDASETPCPWLEDDRDTIKEALEVQDFGETDTLRLLLGHD